LLLDPRTHVVSLANAGHMAPIHRRARGGVAEPGEKEAGLPLGISAGLQYAQATIELAPGDSLTMYTDGLNEANSEGAFYTIDRIRERVKSFSGSPCQLGQFLVDDVCQFIGTGAQGDDMCLVTLGRLT
jgi:phosphoserine phosphatase RsbU/P